MKVASGDREFTTFSGPEVQEVWRSMLSDLLKIAQAIAQTLLHRP